MDTFQVGQAPWETQNSNDLSVPKDNSFAIGEAPWEKPQASPVQEIAPDTIDLSSAEQYKPTFPAKSGQGVGGELLQTPKLLGNLPSSALSFIRGTINFLNPGIPLQGLKNPFTGESLGLDEGNIPKVLKAIQEANQVPGGSKEAVNEAVARLPVSFAMQLPESFRKTMAAFTGLDVNPDKSTVQKLDANGKEEARRQAFDSLINDPVGQIAPWLIAARETARAMNVEPEYEAAVRRVTEPVKGAVGAPFKAIGNKIGEVAPPSLKYAATQMTGLEPSTLEAIYNHPEEFTPEKMSSLSRKSLGEEVASALDERSTELSDTGKGYQPIRNSETPVTVDPNYLSDLIQKKTGVVPDETGKLQTSGSATIRDAGDVRALQNLYDLWEPVFDKGEMTPNEFLNFRSDLADMSKFGRELTKSQPLENTAKGMRADLNSTYRDQLPGLDKLDESYSQQVEDFSRLKKGFIDKNGDLTETAINKIANAAGKGKDILLQRLEEIKPGITHKIKILKAIEDIQATAGNKVGTYGRTAFGASGLTAGIITANIPIIAGALAEMFFSQPENVVKIIQAYKEGAVPLAEKVLEKIGAGKQMLETGKQKVGEALTKERQVKIGLGTEDITKTTDYKAGYESAKNLPADELKAKINLYKTNEGGQISSNYGQNYLAGMEQALKDRNTLYHGTSQKGGEAIQKEGFKWAGEFDGYTTTEQNWVSLTDKLDYAQDYAKESASAVNETGNGQVIKIDKTKLNLYEADKHPRNSGAETPTDFMKRLKAQGYDGAILKGENEVMVWNREKLQVIADKANEVKSQPSNLNTTKPNSSLSPEQVKTNIEAKQETLYHGTTAEAIKKIESKGFSLDSNTSKYNTKNPFISFTSDSGLASDYSINKALLSADIPSARIVKLSDFPEQIKQSISSIAEKHAKEMEKYIDSSYEKQRSISDKYIGEINDIVGDYVASKGISAVNLDMDISKNPELSPLFPKNEIRVYDKNVISNIKNLGVKNLIEQRKKTYKAYSDIFKAKKSAQQIIKDNNLTPFDILDRGTSNKKIGLSLHDYAADLLDYASEGGIFQKRAELYQQIRDILTKK